MANWCNNTVVFEGEPKAIEQVQQLFQTMAEKEKEEEMGQLPNFTTARDGYFFDILCDEIEKEMFQFQTKWSPNLEIVQEIAKYHKVNFIQDYEELGCLMYGRAIYSEGGLKNIHLNDEAFETYGYDEETDTYHFEGKTYESEYEILETLLERKIADHQHKK